MNAFIDIVPGTHVNCGGEHYVISHVLSLETVLAKHPESGRTAPLSVSSLIPYPPIPQEKETGVTEVSSIPDDEWEASERWYEILRPLLNNPRRTRKMVEAVAESIGTHVATIYRELAKVENTERISSLRPVKHSGGKGKSRLSEERENLLQHVIETVYLNKQKPDIAHTYEVLKQMFKKAGFRVIHINTLRNRIKVIPEKEKDITRLGADVAMKKHSAYPGHFPGANFPLAICQIDHTKFDVILLDDRDREPIGRPWVTLMIDVFSRMVLGYHISLDPPGTMSAGLCLANAMLPKEKLLEKFGLKASWACWGKLTKIHADNAGEFRGKMLRRACKEYQIDLEWRPVKKPHYGAHIERLLGTILKKVHSIPGTTFSNIEERGKYDSEGNAILTMSEFEEWFLSYVTGIYHQKVHSSLKRSPIKQYELGILGNEEVVGRGLPRRITDEDRLLLDLMPYEERTIQEYGIVIERVHYFADVLRRWVKARDPQDQTKKRKFIFKRSPKDISVVYFLDPELNQYFRVPYRDTSRPPMSIWEFRRARKRLEDQGIKEIDEEMIFDSYARMLAIEANAAQETKRTRRNRQRKVEDQKSPKPKTADDDVSNRSTARGSAVVDDSVDVPPFDELEEL